MRDGGRPRHLRPGAARPATTTSRRRRDGRDDKVDVRNGLRRGTSGRTSRTRAGRGAPGRDERQHERRGSGRDAAGDGRTTSRRLGGNSSRHTLSSAQTATALGVTRELPELRSAERPARIGDRPHGGTTASRSPECRRTPLHRPRGGRRRSADSSTVPYASHSSRAARRRRPRRARLAGRCARARTTTRRVQRHASRGRRGLTAIGRRPRVGEAVATATSPRRLWSDVTWPTPARCRGRRRPALRPDPRAWPSTNRASARCTRLSGSSSSESRAGVQQRESRPHQPGAPTADKGATGRGRTLEAGLPRPNPARDVAGGAAQVR